MERPDATTTSYFDSALPDDARAVRGQMFGHPCAFVNGHMFYGTFAQTVVVRVGAERAATLAEGKVRLFEPTPGRVWKEYVQLDAGSIPKASLAKLTSEALEFTSKLAPKESARAAAKKTSGSKRTK